MPSPTTNAGISRVSAMAQQKKNRRVRAWTIVVGLLLAVAIFLGLVSGVFPGIPQEKQRALTVFYRPNAGKEGLSLYIQPPMSMLQVEGERQTVALQFTNYLASPVRLEDVTVEPAGCFELVFPPTSPPLLLPNQSIVLLPKFTTRPLLQEDSTRCQQRSLNFVYRWTELHPDGAFIGRKLLSSTNSVATSPITVVSPWKEFWERFFHTLDAIVISVSLPVFLGLLNYLYQRSADRRAARENEQDFKLQVWKEILPSIITLVTQHYVPISRKMDIVAEEMTKLEGRIPFVTGSTVNVLAALLLLRRAVYELYQKNGGWYLRSKRAEQLCTNLADRLWDECDSYSRVVEFRNVAEGFDLTDTLFTIRDKLLSSSVTWERRQLLTDFNLALTDRTKLNRIKRLLDLSTRVLDFECDRPLYPEWYEEPPRFNTSNFSVRGLGLQNEDRVQIIAEEYIAGMRAECKHDIPL